MEMRMESGLENRIHPGTRTRQISLTVSDVERVGAFYQEVIGLKLRSQTKGEARLGTAAEDIVVLVEKPEARRATRTTGLYHLAILLPTRQDLANWLTHMVEGRHSLEGASDHLVSEAIYLSDPEGNGIEVYRDRPRDEWPRQDGGVAMATDPLDMEGLLAERTAAGWAGAPEGTRLGHVHLHVSDLNEAEQFYVGLLGFDLMQRYHGAIFVSAGGYHHHLGLNIWGTAGAPAPHPDSLGLRDYTLAIPDEAERDRLIERLRTAGHLVETTAAGPLVRDPAGNRIVLSVE